MTRLKLEGASFAFRGRRVLEAVELELHGGEMLGIVGANGSGKTTLLRGMLGLLRPVEGRVLRQCESIGYVPQREVLDELYPLRALDLVRMGAFGRLTRWRRLRPEDERLALACLERVGLAARARAGFAELSGGQRQRVLVARALMVRPDLLLLDEPTSGVDEAAAEQILDLLCELRDVDGVAIGIVSHQLEALARHANRVAIVEAGRLNWEATARGASLAAANIRESLGQEQR